MYLFPIRVRGKGEFSVSVSEVNGLVDTRTPMNHSRVGMHCSEQQIIILSLVPFDYYEYS